MLLSMEYVKLADDLEGQLTAVGEPSEKIDLFELVVNGKRFGCLEKEKKAFEAYLATIPGDHVELRFFHSTRLRLEQVRRGRGKTLEVKKEEEGGPKSVDYNCTTRAPKEYARVMFEDMQRRCERLAELLAQSLVESYLNEQKAPRRIPV